MPATVTWYVDPDAAGAGTGADWTNAYTSVNAATDAKAKNLVASDEIYVFECRSSAGTADTTTLSLSSGWNCDATRYIVIRATSGHWALKTGWSTSSYRISVTDAAAISSTATALVVYFEHLQVERVWTSVSWDYVFTVYSAAAGTKFYLNGCRMRTNNANTGIITLADADCTMYLWDCILDGTSRYCFNISNGTGYMYNSICQGAGTDAIIIAAGKTAVFKNVACYNNTDDFQDNSGGTATIDYCASDDGDGTNAKAPSGGNWDNEFVDSATNGDYTILNTGNLFEGGIDDPGAGLYTTDIDGDAWVSPWSIGVDQYPPPPPTDFPSFLTMDMKNRLGNMF